MTTVQERPTAAAAPALLPDGSPRPGTARLALVLGAFVALGPLTIDMYLPALPSITDQLGTTSATVQLTLTGTLIGLALGQLVLGPLSDAWGRRRPLLAGTALHVVASLLVLVAPNIAVLGALRVFQGVGTAAGAVIALAIVRDLYDGRAAATMLSRLFLVLGAAPVLAPTVGGELLRFTSWRGIFAVLAAYGALMVVVGWFFLKETLPEDRRNSSGVRGTLRGYRVLLRDRTYVGLVLVAGLTMAGLFSYVSGSAFVYQEEFGLDEQQFGLLFGAGAFWLIAATQLNPVLLAAGRRRSCWLPARSPARSAARRWCSWRRRRPVDCGPCRACGRCCSPAGWPCPTRLRWRCRGTVRPPVRPPRCSARSSSASGRWSRPWSVSWATTPSRSARSS